MKCPGCQEDNPPTARYCLGCGARVAFACSSCGTELPGTARFCFQCGQIVGDGTAKLVGSPAPETRIPRHLAEKILTSRAALEGERKQVTVLFADLKGSMELLADRDPEEARRLLDAVLALMMDAVHRYEGTVNQVMGDGVMALFGAPVAHEDHAVRACYAALQIQDAIRRYSDDLRRAQGIEVQARVGLNSGEVVVRAIRSDLHMDYTAVGQTVHLAARMEQLAAPGSSRLTAATLQLVEGYVEVRPLGLVPVKGLGELLAVYELVGVGSARTRLQAAGQRGLSRFVGRRAEMNGLRGALEKAERGNGQIVGVIGEPGVGKSRLFWELIRSHRTQGWLTLETSAASWGKSTAYLLVVRLLRAYFQIEDGDDPRRLREKVTGKVLALDQTLAPAVPALLALLDVVVEDVGWQEIDPLQQRQRTLDAVRRLLVRESQVQPLVLVFEDLHWCDGESEAVLDRLVEGLPAARMLLLVNYRPEYECHWGSKSYYTQLRVDPLPVESASLLLDAVLGDDAGLGSLKRRLIERTEGNPFFLEECVRTLVETSALVGERGAYDLAAPIDTIQIPATVQSILAARIDRLSPEEKSLLQTAAVIGERVPYTLLRAVAGASDEQLRPALAHLHSAEFLYEASLFPDVEYSFKHALTHDVAYLSLLHERRRGLHARILAAVEQLSPDRPPEDVDRLAHHALRGEIWEKAVQYLRRAGAKATTRSAHREAVSCFEQALEALARLPMTPETTATAIDLRLDLRTALTPLGQYGRVIDLLREAENLARELHDDRRLGHVIADLSARLRNTGDHAGALEAGRRARAIADTLGDRDLHFEATYRLAQAHFAVGDVASSVVLLRRAVEILGEGSMRAGSRLPGYLAGWPHSWLAIGLAMLGHFADAIRHGEAAVQIAELADHPHSRIEAQAALGRVYLERGDLDRAIGLFELGLGPSVAWNIWDSGVFSGLGYAYVLAGKVGEGLPLLREAVERGQSIDAMAVGHAVRLTRLGEGCLMAGRLDEAHARAQQALEFARTRKEQANEAYALRLLGEIAAHRPAPEVEAAERWLRDGMGRAETLGLQPLAAHCHFSVGKLCRRSGKQPEAQEHLAAATGMYREMDMRFWLGQGEAELGMVQ
jgi:class 3 adenylate cyclase/tetratricopeptide (TPR) repeat protein